MGGYAVLRKTWILAALLAFAGPASNSARAEESVSVAIGGHTLMAYLPFALAYEKGYFKEAGLGVRINDFKGGAQAAEALVGGSADICIGAHEHTLVIQSKGLILVDVALLNISYGAVIALKPDLAKKYKSPADLKGLKFGVTSPGSASALALELLLAKVNLPVTSISIIGIGAGPSVAAAVKSGQLDGVSQFDPLITQLLHDGDIVSILDTRNEAGMKYLYGGPIAGSGTLTSPKFIAEHRASVQAFVSAEERALKWLVTASADDVVKSLKPEYFGADIALYKQSLEMNQASFSRDGKIEPAAVANIYRVLSEYGPLKGKPKIDLAKSYDNSFLAK